MKLSVSIAITLLGLTSGFQTPSTTNLRRHGTRSDQACPSSLKKPLYLPATSRGRHNPSTTELELAPALTAIASSPIGAISVLAGIVTVHEFGHYLAARSYNISVDEFAVGFGPKLGGFKAFGNEFNLRALPLGGYVRFPINYDVNATQQLEQAARDAFMQRRKDEEWGPVQDFINIATFGIWDERRRRQRKEQQALQEVEEASKRSWFQKAVGVGNIPKKVEVDPEDFEIEYYDDPDLLQNRPWFQRAVVLSMGVIFNMILAFSLYFGEIRFGSGIPEPVFDSGVVISQAPLKGGASVGILQEGDVIVGVNGM